MIVVDSNVLVYLYLPTELSHHAIRLREIEPDWCAPRLWRSEMCNVLALYLRQQLISFEQACRIQAMAESLLADREFEVPSFNVLTLADNSLCSAYDCEFVALAKHLGIKLVTADKKVVTAFPETVTALAAAAA